MKWLWILTAFNFILIFFHWRGILRVYDGYYNKVLRMATGTSVSHYVKNIQKQPCSVNLCIQSEYGGIQTSRNSAYALSHTDSASIFENRLITMWSSLHFFFPLKLWQHSVLAYEIYTCQYHGRFFQISHILQISEITVCIIYTSVFQDSFLLHLNNFTNLISQYADFPA